MDYPFISPCGREMNYVSVADTPIVFHDMSLDGKCPFRMSRHRNCNPNIGSDLFWGGSFSSTFDPANVYVSRSTGHVYHSTPTQMLKNLPPENAEIAMETSTAVDSGLSLISSAVAQRIFENTHVDQNGTDIFLWRGKSFVFKYIH